MKRFVSRWLYRETTTELLTKHSNLTKNPTKTNFTEFLCRLLAISAKTCKFVQITQKTSQGFILSPIFFFSVLLLKMIKRRIKYAKRCRTNRAVETAQVSFSLFFSTLQGARFRGWLGAELVRLRRILGGILVERASRLLYFILLYFIFGNFFETALKYLLEGHCIRGFFFQKYLLVMML